MKHYKERILLLLAAAIAMGGCSLSNTEDGADQSSAPANSAENAENTDNDGPAENGDKEGNADNTVSSGTAAAEIDAAVDFSAQSGFYDTDCELTLSSTEDVKIFYTTDGSVPTMQSTEYSEPIVLKNRTRTPNVISEQSGMSADGDAIPWDYVDKCNIIRAAAFDSNGKRGPVYSHTYFVGINREKKYGDVPVISLMTDFDNLFDYETGIYTLGKAHDEWLAESPSNKNIEGWKHEANYTQRGREWERPVYVEYLNFDGSVGFGQDMGMRIMGAASRNNSQKSLRLIARADYSEKAVNYEVIPDNERSDKTGNVEKYKSFVLRNGGNDSSFARIRDPYLQDMIADKDLETQQSTPAVVYLDGEYWGMYTIVEDYNDNYIENNYGIDNKNVVIIKTGEIEEGEESDYQLYSDMYEFITGNDMADADNYAKACEMLDMNDFADYLAFNIYIFNEDCIFQGNNWRMWRVREPDAASPKGDGKWRTMVYDTDYSSGIYSGGGNYNTNNIKTAIEGTNIFVELEQPPAEMFRALLANEDFKKTFVLSLCDMRNISFEKEKAEAALTAMAEQYRKLVNSTFDRWMLFWSDYNGNVEGLKKFITNRYDRFLPRVNETFTLGDTAEVTVKQAEGGSVIVNTTALDTSKDFKGTYFTCYPIKLTAVPEEGKKFVRWETEDCEVSDSTSAEIEVSFAGDCELTPVFE